MVNAHLFTLNGGCCEKKKRLIIVSEIRILYVSFLISNHQSINRSITNIFLEYRSGWFWWEVENIWVY